jgi:hypothetical protein
VAELGPAAARDLAVDTMVALVPEVVVTRIVRRRCRDPAAAVAGIRSMFPAVVGRQWEDFRRQALDPAVDKSRDPAAVGVRVGDRFHALAADRYRDPVADRLPVVLAAPRDPVAEGDLHNVIWITSSTSAVPAAAAVASRALAWVRLWPAARRANS